MAYVGNKKNLQISIILLIIQDNNSNKPCHHPLYAKNILSHKKKKQ